MLSEINITDARKDLSSLYDSVFNFYKPSIIKRKQTEEVLLLRADLQKMLLFSFSLKPEVLHEDDGSITLALDQLELAVNNETLDLAVNELLNDLKLYAEDYFNRSQLFINSPNRKSHFPYLLRIMLCEDDSEIRSLLEL